MKNTDKKLIFKFSNIADVEFGEDAPTGACERLQNMRRVGGCLRPTGQMLPFSVLAENERLLAMHRTAEGVNIITYSSGNVMWHGTMTGDAYTPKGVAVGSLSAEPSCAETIGDFVVIGCRSGDVYLHCDGEEYVLLNRDSAIPQIRLVAEEAGAVSATVARYEFRNGYTHWQSPLELEDLSAISANMRSAYTAIRGRAEAKSAHVQPVLARYGVRLYDDSYLWVSQPLLLGVGVQCGTELRTAVESDSAAYKATAACEMTAKTFSISAEAIGGFDKSWDKMVKSVDILLTDELKPLLTSQNIEYRCETTTTGSRIQYLMMNFRRADVAATIGDVMCSGDWRVAYQITDFNALRAGTAKLLPVPHGEIVDSKAMAACSQAISRRSCSSALVPHNRRMFGCVDTAILKSGWASVAAINVDGSRKETFDVVVAARISTDHGAALTVWHGKGSGLPLSINPIVAYPDPRAVSITVMVKTASSGVKTCVAQLQPAHKAGLAYAVSRDMAPMVFEETGVSALDVPEAVNIEEKTTGVLQESAEMNPLVAKAWHRVCDGRIRALGAALHHSNNAIGTPMYVFADSGVYALPYRTVSAAYAPAVVISRHVIASGTKPVNVTDKLCFATDGGKLCVIGQYKTEELRRDVGEVREMAYNLDRRELWIRDSMEQSIVIAADGTMYMRSEKFGSLFAASAGVPVAVAKNGAMYSLRREVGNLADVELLTRPFSPTDAEEFVPTEFMLNICAKNCNIEITVLGDNGISCHGMMLCRLKINGAVNSPIKARLFSPKLRKMRVAIKGKMPAEAVVEWCAVRYKSLE